jgi:hypothetical protein
MCLIPAALLEAPAGIHPSHEPATQMLTERIKYFDVDRQRIALAVFDTVLASALHAHPAPPEHVTEDALVRWAALRAEDVDRGGNNFHGIPHALIGHYQRYVADHVRSMQHYGHSSETDLHGRMLDEVRDGLREVPHDQLERWYDAIVRYRLRLNLRRVEGEINYLLGKELDAAQQAADGDDTLLDA